MIIPIYNEENTLLEILNKVNSQSTDKFSLEIIVIDDCSTDGSRKIIERNLDLVSNYIKLEKNGGKGAAVREGLKKATGDYILFQDGDLEYNPEDYNKIFKVMTRPFFVTYILHIMCHWKVHGIITITHFTINK